MNKKLHQAGVCFATTVQIKGRRRFSDRWVLTKSHSVCVCVCVSRELTGGKVSLQGNMDPCALYAPKVTSTPPPLPVW